MERGRLSARRRRRKSCVTPLASTAQPKRLALSTPAASPTRLGAAHRHYDPRRERPLEQSDKPLGHWAIGPLGRRYAKSAAETKPRSRVTITSSRRPPYSREISWPKAARGDARGRIRCPSPHAQSSSSAITIPERVFSFAAKSAATVKPRAQTRASPLANTGQPSRSHRLMCFAFSKRFSLWAF